jgi:L-asparaginase II
MDEGIGIALKIEDGSSRAIEAVILELLKKLGLVSAAEYDRLKEGCKMKIKNHRKEIIGEIKAAF